MYTFKDDKLLCIACKKGRVYVGCSSGAARSLPISKDRTKCEVSKYDS